MLKTGSPDILLHLFRSLFAKKLFDSDSQSCLPPCHLQLSPPCLGPNTLNIANFYGTENCIIFFYCLDFRSDSEEEEFSADKKEMLMPLCAIQRGVF